MILNVLVPALVQAALISELVILAATSGSQSVLDQCAFLRRHIRTALWAVLSSWFSGLVPHVSQGRSNLLEVISKGFFRSLSPRKTSIWGLLVPR